MTALERAEAYDRHVGRYTTALAAAFVQFAGIEPGMRVLDIGCGPGALTAALAQVVGAARVGAVDPSEDYVAACRARISGVDARVGAGEDLPFEDDRFEAVLAQLVIQALEDPPRAAREMARVAAPGGIVATCVWDFRAGMPLFEAYWSAAVAVDPAGASRAGGDAGNPWCTKEGLERLWRGTGLDEIETGELVASASYADLDDAWWSFAAGVGPSGAYCRSLGERKRAALRREFRGRLGAGDEPFRLTARAWAVRGRAP